MILPTHTGLKHAIANQFDGDWVGIFISTIPKASGGIFAINGPPGTGKTTLLMDVIAALVVERAKALCDFDKPCAAFEKGWEVKYGDLPNPAAVFRLDWILT